MHRRRPPRLESRGMGFVGSLRDAEGSWRVGAEDCSSLEHAQAQHAGFRLHGIVGALGAFFPAF